MPSPDAIYRFGPCELRAKSRELYKNGIRLKIRLQPFKVLLALVERPGEVVTREELRRLLWPADTFVDIEHGLNTSIKELRGLLNDSSSAPRYIETLPKLGYRLVAPVVSDLRQDTIPQEALTVRKPRSGDGSPYTVPWAVVHPRWIIAATIAIVLIAGLAAYVQWSRPRGRSQASNRRVMLAVLPFQNLTGDANQEYFSDGLTEEMVTQLGDMDPLHLGVIARTSIMNYKNKQVPVDQIGRELGVQYVLEGSFRRDGDKVRITAQLIQVKDQTHVWAREYDRELKDLLSLEDEIAHEISGEVQVAFFDSRKPRPHQNQPSLSPQASEAHNLYLQGLYFWNKRTVQGFEEAIDYFQQSIDKEPNFARAYAGLADSYVLLDEFSFSPRPELIQKGRAAALQALKIAPNLAEAHTAFALIVENYEWDWATAEKEYRRAIELDPNYATAHHWYAEYLMWMGRFDEALRESELARQLDPLSLIIATDHGAILYYSRQYDRAIAELRSVQAMDPSFPRAGGILLEAYVEKGMFTEAQDVLARLPVEASGRWLLEAYLYGRFSRQARARHALEKLLKWTKRHQPARQEDLALAYLGLGDKDKAMACLEEAYAQRSILVNLKVDPAFDPLRSDPRFHELLQKMRFSK